ncbi:MULTISPECIES: hypothetical protein [Thermomonospora]|jgi:hypothetical protein|uniref:Uncharacterized protein n=1 Tax=Thermomonospora curvata (strain ATCC 19995 / DSM 43183 / JCM 3096 / KCTC 9072 / NBRC 15933 / NCIMB 10081 / Henssen B9) TaxID=471852 RepID=D1A656_THECD|nr:MULTISPECIES: hypothetical protein [Thermomonospora]ACZ00155.1 hypothetical protein Tcur_4633 [Thermomonospora curvata DSM 43183]PKK11974.1 MAG: hypothetical protein BUE48_022740 [Thermomonospora sp. CIF 1]
MCGTAAVAAGMLLVGACTQDAGTTGTAISQTPAGLDTPTVSTPQPASLQEYAATLRSALRRMDKPLKDLRKAGKYKGLAGRVAPVEEAAVEAAAMLRDITPPPELAGRHPRLLTALEEFHKTVGVVERQVKGRDLCTGPAVWADLGEADATDELRDALREVTAVLPGKRPGLALPPAGHKFSSRPSNGTFIRSSGLGGRGGLTIDNGSGDAVVTLVRGGSPRISVYVRRGGTYTVRGISDGTYRIYFASGSAWDPKNRSFGRDCRFQRFEESLRFQTVYTATQIRWSNWRITLHPVLGGQARTRSVDPGAFPN